jgi:hypothetical protein
LRGDVRLVLRDKNVFFGKAYLLRIYSAPCPYFFHFSPKSLID